jgi:hypothetical protein
MKLSPLSSKNCRYYFKLILNRFEKLSDLNHVLEMDLIVSALHKDRID